MFFKTMESQYNIYWSFHTVHWNIYCCARFSIFRSARYFLITRIYMLSSSYLLNFCIFFNYTLNKLRSLNYILSVEREFKLCQDMELWFVKVLLFSTNFFWIFKKCIVFLFISGTKHRIFIKFHTLLALFKSYLNSKI